MKDKFKIGDLVRYKVGGESLLTEAFCRSVGFGIVLKVEGLKSKPLITWKPLKRIGLYSQDQSRYLENLTR
jgi:hypothetical protein